MKLFSKFSKDYNNLVEEILERKTFSSISKSLLLSMIYKLEIAYKDYVIVKPEVLTKDEFMTYILDIIEKYCDNIKTVEPESVGAELLMKHQVEAVTNNKERSILAYPTEQAMLYAICDIEPKYFFAKKDFVFKKVLQKVLVTGYKQNTAEILRNFNGWSWDVTCNKQDNESINVMYQNLLLIKGEKFLFEWRTDNQVQKDYLAELKRSIKNVTGNDEYYLSFCKLLYKIAERKDKMEMTAVLKEEELKYQEFLKRTAEFRKKNMKEFYKLRMYHEILKDKKTAQEELIELQKQFLNFFKKKIDRMTQKEEMLEMIYLLRYYQNIRWEKNKLILESAELMNMLDIVMKLAFTKACKMGVLKIVCMDIDTNFEVLKYILDTRMIDLKDIRVYIECEKQEIFVKVYDKEVFEKQGKLPFNGNKKDIVIKKKRLVSLLN